MVVAKYLTEFIGTFFLVLVICLMTTQGNDHTGIVAPLAIGCTLMIMVYMGGHVSGGHYNPAVTLACFLRGACGWADVVPYWISQVAGACAAAFVSSIMLLPGTEEAALPVYKIVAPGAGYTLAIGFTVVVAAYAGGGISGGAYNPAVGVGPNIIGGTIGQDPGALANIVLYIAGPMIGGALAAVVFKIQEAWVDHAAKLEAK